MGDDQNFFIIEHSDRELWHEVTGSFAGVHIFHSWEWSAAFVDAYGHRPVLVCEGTPGNVVSFIPVSLVPRPFGRFPAVSHDALPAHRTLKRL